MTKAYRAEVRERLKNCVGARFSAEALVIALVGERLDQNDWSFECNWIISLLDDDADYRRGYEDGLKANTRAAFAAAKQALGVRTCKPIEKDSVMRCSECDYPLGIMSLPAYCAGCGAKVVG